MLAWRYIKCFSICLYILRFSFLIIDDFRAHYCLLIMHGFPNEDKQNVRNTTKL